MKSKKRLKVVKQVISVSPGLFILEYLTSALYGASLAFTPLLMEKAFDSIQAFYTGRLSWGSMLERLGWLFIVMVLSEITAGFSDFLGETYSDLAAQKLFSKINEKICKLPAIDFEVPEILNKIQKSYSGAFYSRSALHIIMDFFTMYLPYFIVYAWYLYKSRPIFPIALLLIFLPIVLTQHLKKKIYESQADMTTPMQRRRDTLISYLTSKETAKETRTLGAYTFFTQKIDTVQANINQVLRSNDRKMRCIDMSAIFINLIGYFGVIWLLLDSVRIGVIQISTFVAVFASLRTAYDQLDEVFTKRAAEFSEALANMGNYIAFLDIDEADFFPANEETITSLRAENLGFQYPDGTSALRGVNFYATRGDCIAVVGENGSGKTTLAKILAGIYRPSSGNLYTNGDIQEPSAFRHCISQCFQRFCCYQMTIAGNIGISQFDKKNRSKIVDLLEQVHFSFDAEKMPDGIDTLLGRAFGGVEFSGGQWQRIALSRANYRYNDLLILDEPTASIDPLHENELYYSFSTSCSGKISFIITHRLGIVKLCSSILVLKDGKQIDFGTHDELLERSPYYRTLWQSQANMYT